MSGVERPTARWDRPHADVIHLGGPGRVYDDTHADPDYEPPPFLGFQPPGPQPTPPIVWRWRPATVDEMPVYRYDPRPAETAPLIQPGDLVHVCDTSGREVSSFIWQPLPTVTITDPDPRLAIADQDPDEWGDQA